MNRFKLIAGILSLVGILSFSYGAELRIAPGMGSLGKDCIQGFDIYLDMEEGEEALALDVILDSNMEFINFENAGLFASYIPPRELGKQIHFVLMNVGYGNITGGGLLGKVYYRTMLDEDPYISFFFEGQGVKTDTNVAINGIDILNTVNGGNYTLDDSISCVEFTGEIYSEVDFHNTVDEIVKQLNESTRITLRQRLFTSNICYIVLGVVLILVLLCVFLKKGRK